MVVYIVVVALVFVTVLIGFSCGQEKFNWHSLRLLLLVMLFVAHVVIVVLNVLVVVLFVVADHITFIYVQ